MRCDRLLTFLSKKAGSNSSPSGDFPRQTTHSNWSAMMKLRVSKRALPSPHSTSARLSARRRKRVRQKNRRGRFERLEPRLPLSITIGADDPWRGDATRVSDPVDGPYWQVSQESPENSVLTYVPTSSVFNVRKMIVAGDPNGSPSDSPHKSRHPEQRH